LATNWSSSDFRRRGAAFLWSPIELGIEQASRCSSHESLP